MASDSDERSCTAKRVTKLLQHPEATQAFPGVLPNGTRQVLVAMPGDALGPIFRRVKSFGGPTNIAVADAEGFAVIVITPSRDEVEVGAEECPVSGKSAIGLLLSLLRSNGGSARCRLTEPDYEAELVDDGVCVPA